MAVARFSPGSVETYTRYASPVFRRRYVYHDRPEKGDAGRSWAARNHQDRCHGLYYYVLLRHNGSKTYFNTQTYKSAIALLILIAMLVIILLITFSII